MNIVVNRSAPTTQQKNARAVDEHSSAPTTTASMVARTHPASHPSVFQGSRLVTMMPFRVELEIFRGPLDLLLYLVRKHEVDVAQVPISRITAQFLEYLEVLEFLDVNAVGDFLEMASLLVEIKSKVVLPRCDEEEDEELNESQELLVQQLLEYKQYKDAASILEERGRDWSQCFTRLANDLPPRDLDPADQPIQEVELWDLVSALGRVMRANELSRPTSIIYDETPIHVYMERIHRRLTDDGQVAFSDMFNAGMHKSAMIGVFLALLELVRHHCVNAEQDGLHGEIYLKPGESFGNTLDLSDVDSYDGSTAAEGDGAEDPTPDSAPKPR